MMSVMPGATPHQHSLADVVEFDEPPSAMFLVLSLDMVLTHVSEGGKVWLTDFRKGWLEDELNEVSGSALALGIERVLDSFDVRARLLCVSTETQRQFGCYLVTVEVSQHNPCLALLNPREIQVAEYAIHGATNSEIASGLKIGVAAVKAHLKQIYLKLEVSNRVELAQALARRVWPIG